MPDLLFIDNPPPLPGLSFRCFRGPEDYPAMASILVASEAADGIDRQVTPEMLAGAYQNLSNCDPYQDMIFAEVNGEVAGYARAWWEDEAPAAYLYKINAFLLPEWRRKGIGRAMQTWLEDRLRAIAAAHPPETPRLFHVTAFNYQEGKAKLLESLGYQPIRYFYNMVRPTLEDIPAYPLPEGVELRPVLQENYRLIWDSFHADPDDEWGYVEPTEERYQEWLAEPHFQPHLWQVAWDTASDQTVGHVLTFVDEHENQQFNRRRGYTEGVGVRRDWRRKGLAKAMIARSLQVQRDAGMTESALAVDADSQSNAIRLYESLGFQVVTRDTIYRKPLLF